MFWGGREGKEERRDRVSASEKNERVCEIRGEEGKGGIVPTGPKVKGARLGACGDLRWGKFLEVGRRGSRGVVEVVAARSRRGAVLDSLGARAVQTGLRVTYPLR